MPCTFCMLCFVHVGWFLLSVFHCSDRELCRWFCAVYPLCLILPLLCAPPLPLWCFTQGSDPLVVITLLTFVCGACVFSFFDIAFRFCWVISLIWCMFGWVVVLYYGLLWLLLSLFMLVHVFLRTWMPDSDRKGLLFGSGVAAVIFLLLLPLSTSIHPSSYRLSSFPYPPPCGL